MVNNYDKIARHYDFLSRLVFSNAQVIAQVNQLKYIPENSSILIAGGGTGWIIEEITKVRSSGLKIVYVEISAEMIELAKAKTAGNNEVIFVHSGIAEFTTQNIFDLILTPFLFDNFSEETASLVFRQLNLLLKDKGIWFFVDFSISKRNGIWWKKLLLNLMYIFFRQISNIEAKKLIDIHPSFLGEDYRVVDEQFYYGNFIRATVYQK